MIKKFFAFTLALLFVLNGTAVFADTKKPKGKKSAGQTRLVSLLPASDGVVLIDVQRLLNDALPQILSSNPAKLNEINEQIDHLKTQIGFDVRQFEHIAVGIAFKQTANAKNLVDPVILLRGKYNSEALLTLAKIAGKGKYREEKAGNKAFYIFAAKEILAEHKAKITGNMPDKFLDTLMQKLPSELAVATVDGGTLAIGSVARVREMFESKAKIDPSLTALVNRKSSSILSFAASTPTGLKQFINLDDDMLGQSMSAIRLLHGSVDVAGGNVVSSVTAKLINAQQAKSLEETLGGLQGLIKGLLASARGDDKKVYARIIENAKITRLGTDVTVDAQVANADIALLIK
jgi:hypothetical protein